MQPIHLLSRVTGISPRSERLRGTPGPFAGQRPSGDTFTPTAPRFGEAAQTLPVPLQQQLDEFIAVTRATPPIFDFNGLPSILKGASPEHCDAAVAYIAEQFPEIQQLYLSETAITSKGLAPLAGLKDLTLLSISETQVTDEGMHHLAGLENLGMLYLSETKITDAGLQHLSGLKNLHALFLTENKITDAGLPHLSGLTKLKELYLGHTQVTDEGLQHLSGLKSLVDLILNGTRITGQTFPVLAALPNLQYLSLAGTQVTDQQLNGLTYLETLSDLKVDHTPITEAGLRYLATEIPTLDFICFSPDQASEEGQKFLRSNSISIDIEP